jgi:pyruvate formate lyase activating enzyme
LQKLKALGVHTAIETSGYFEWDRFNDLMLDWLDLILFDVKLADPELHAKYTGQRNDTILKTLALLAGKRPDDIIARVPLIPGITTSRDNLFRLSGILHDLGINRCCLLPYNPSGFSKRNNIGQPPVNLPEHLLTGEEIHRCEVLFPRLELVEV